MSVLPICEHPPVSILVGGMVYHPNEVRQEYLPVSILKTPKRSCVGERSLLRVVCAQRDALSSCTSRMRSIATLLPAAPSGPFPWKAERVCGETKSPPGGQDRQLVCPEASRSEAGDEWAPPFHRQSSAHKIGGRVERRFGLRPGPYPKLTRCSFAKGCAFHSSVAQTTCPARIDEHTLPVLAHNIRRKPHGDRASKAHRGRGSTELQSRLARVGGIVLLHLLPAVVVVLRRGLSSISGRPRHFWREFCRSRLGDVS